MSKISIKTDFADGDILPASDLNNNFRVIQAGVNANEENLQEVIDQAIVELDAELEAITADRGWDWNGGNRVTFYKGDTDAIDARAITNGQLLYNTETGETALDDNNSRIVTGSGNVIAIGESEPTNPATKEWIKPSMIMKFAAGNNIYSETETIVGRWIDNKPIYRKVIKFLKSELESGGNAYNHNISNIGDLVNVYGVLKRTDNITQNIIPWATSNNDWRTFIADVDATTVSLNLGSSAYSDTSYVLIIMEYTKTTD